LPLRDRPCRTATSSSRRNLRVRATILPPPSATRALDDPRSPAFQGAELKGFR
jgi:hypothetical protein